MSEIELNTLVISFQAKVTADTIGIIKRLAPSDDKEELEVGDEIDIDYTLAGDFSDTAMAIAMLFNKNRVSNPTFRVCRGVKPTTNRNEEGHRKWNIE